MDQKIGFKMKFVFFAIMIISLTFYNSEAQYNNGIKLSSSYLTDELDSINTNDYHYSISKINCEKIKDLLKTEKKYVMIYVYGTWCPTTILSSEIVSQIIDKAKDNVEPLIISADFCTNSQVEFLKKFLMSRKLRLNSYIIENDFTEIADLFEFQKTEHIGTFISCFDNEYLRIKVPSPDGRIINLSPLPYFCIINKNNQIIYKNVYTIDEKKINSGNVKPEDFFKLDYEEILKILQN